MGHEVKGVIMAKKDSKSMTPAELAAHITELKAKVVKLEADGEKLDAAIAAGEPITPTADGSSFILKDGYITGDPPKEEPAPKVATAYQLPTLSMRKALDRFDALTDDAQLDHLAGLWGCA